MADKMSDQIAERNSMFPSSIPGSDNSLLKYYSFGLPVSCIATLPDIANRTGRTFRLNYNELLTTRKISDRENKKPLGELTTVQNSGSFDSKWKQLTGKPVIDTSKVYGYTSRPSKEPVMSNSRLYRTTAFIFNSMMSLNHPQAYQPAKYPLSDKSK